jgi:hypothetical protein
MKIYYYINGSQRVGPFNKQELMNLVGNGTLALNDLIYDVRNSQWTKILSHPDFLKTEARVAESAKMVNEDNTLSVSINTSGTNSSIGTVSSIQLSNSQTGSSTQIDPRHPQLKWSIKQGVRTLGPLNTLAILIMYKNGELGDKDLIKSDKDNEWKTFRGVFPSSMLEQIKMMEPAAGAASDGPEFVKFNQLIYAGNMLTQNIVHGLSISPNGITFASSSPIFKDSEEVTVMFQSTKGRPISIPGAIASVSNIPSKHDGFPLIKYVLKFNAQFALTNL